MLEFGKRIKELRKQKGLTQEKLAQRLWVSKSIISAYEAGLKYPSLDILINLAYTFNVSTDYLLGVNKKQFIDVTGLNITQVEVLNKIIGEFRKK